MTMPFSRNTDYAPGVGIKSQDLLDCQNYLAAIYSAILSLKKMRLDGAGNQAAAPASLLELLGSTGNTIPELAALNGAGKIRWLLDHNGLPVSNNLGKFEEGWLLQPAVSGSSWTNVLGAGASIGVSAPVAAYNHRYLTIVPSTAATATDYAITYSPPLFLCNAAPMSLALRFDVGLNAAAAGTASKTSWYLGFDSAGVDPSNDTNVLMLKKPDSAANWQLVANNGGIRAGTNSSTPPTSGTNPADRVKIEIHGSGSPTASYLIRLYVNEALLLTSSASLPAASAMRLVFGSSNEGGAPVGSPAGYLGRLEMAWNIFDSPSAF